MESLRPLLGRPTRAHHDPRRHPRTSAASCSTPPCRPRSTCSATAPTAATTRFDRISANCQNAPACTTALPNIRELIEDGITRLDRRPSVGKLTAEAYVHVLTDNVATQWIPEIITTVATGNRRQIERLGPDLVLGFDEPDDTEARARTQVPPRLRPILDTAEGAALTILCSEDAPYLDRTASPDIAHTFRPTTQAVIDQDTGSYALELCEIWNVPPVSDHATQPVTSDIPALILSSAADGTTPTPWATLTQETLSNSTLATIPGETNEIYPTSHGLLGGSLCLEDVTLAFLDNPHTPPNTDCAPAENPVRYRTNPR